MSFLHGWRGVSPLNPIVTFLLAGLAHRCASLASPQQYDRYRSAPSQQMADVYYVTKSLDHFAKDSLSQKQAADNFHAAAQQSLEISIAAASQSEDKDLLEAAAILNEENRLEKENAHNAMLSLVSTMKQAMGSSSAASSCQELSCGQRAYCTVTPVNGARCQCEAGYQGDGFVCQSPLDFIEHALPAQSMETSPQIADLHVTTLRNDMVALAFRDSRLSNKGYLMLGKAGQSGMQWTPPVSLSGESQAFNPVVAQLESTGNPKLAIAYRDKNQGGAGLLRTATVDPTGRVSFGTPKPFANNQAQAMALVPMPNSSVAVLFSEHVTTRNGVAMHGSVLLAHMPDVASVPDILNKRHFATGPVARITAQRLSPVSFAIGFRHGTSRVGDDTSEASCVMTQLRGTQFLLEHNPVLIEPTGNKIWSRSIALLDDNVISYSYHIGGDALTKEAILRLDPVTQKLSILQTPEVIARGFTPFVGTVSTALFGDGPPSILQRDGPRLFTYYNKAGSKHVQVRICKATDNGIPAACEEADWIKHDVLSIAGANVGDGRLLFVYTDAVGRPYYQLIGMLETRF